MTPDWSTYARSVSDSESQILSWIMGLYLDGEPFDLDATYSSGRMWDNLPQPRIRSDIMVEESAQDGLPLEYDLPIGNKIAADARVLPLPSSSLSSIMFDPPFVAKNTRRHDASLGVIEKRFSGYPTAEALWSMYTDSLTEFKRVLAPGGILAFKCQDTISGGFQYVSHVHVINEAVSMNFICEDIFILTSKTVLWSPNMANQKHARKFHCYYIVFKKGK